MSDEHKNDSPKYTPDQVIECSETTAKHFIDRGVAVAVTGRMPVTEAPKPVEKIEEPELTEKTDKPKAK